MDMKNNTLQNIFTKLGPILFGFFVMGFVDVVGISTSYVKADFGLNDKLANLLPMMVFLWFAIFSLPTGMWMGRIGRKKTVLLSALITIGAMLIPLVSYTFPSVLLAFALLGIGNTILQVALNPFLAAVVQKEKVTRMLTLGQFIKAISSFMGPVIAGVAAGTFGNWKLIFPIYAAVTLLSFCWLLLTRQTEQSAETAPIVRTDRRKEIFHLFADRYLLMLFSVIVLIVGFEIGLMTAVPKYLQEHCALSIGQAGLGCSLYYAARTLGTFAGSLLLGRVSSRRYLMVSMAVGVVALAVFMLGTEVWVMLSALFIVGLACANVFPVIFSIALQSDSSKANEISALMIMGVAGGALIPPLMGVVADWAGQAVSLLIPMAILVYIGVIAWGKIQKKQTI